MTVGSQQCTRLNRKGCLGTIGCTRGQSLLLSKSGVSWACGLMNSFMSTTINIEHNKDPVKSAFGDHILIDWEGLLYFQIGSHNFNEKAQKYGIEVCLCGDGAELTSGNRLVQTSVGFKLTDLDARHPDTGNYYLWRKKKMSLVYQSTRTCKTLQIMRCAIS